MRKRRKRAYRTPMRRPEWMRKKSWRKKQEMKKNYMSTRKEAANNVRMMRKRTVFPSDFRLDCEETWATKDDDDDEEDRKNHHPFGARAVEKRLAPSRANSPPRNRLICRRRLRRIPGNADFLAESDNRPGRTAGRLEGVYYNRELTNGKRSRYCSPDAEFSSPHQPGRPRR